MKRRMRNLLTEGCSLAAIAEECKLSTDSVLLNLMADGLTLSTIAKQCGVSTCSLIQNIDSAVHAGRVLRSQVQSALNKDWLDLVAPMTRNPRVFTPKVISHMLKETYSNCDLDLEEVALYVLYCKKSYRAIDLYEVLHDMERTLHTKIKEVLIRKYHEFWWKTGVPKSVRTSCQVAVEDDPEHRDEHPYDYTTLLNLKEILDKQWSLFGKQLPLDVAQRKPDLMKDFNRLNAIRNKVMHPVRHAPPSDEEFAFAKHMQMQLDISRWPKTPAA